MDKDYFADGLPPLLDSGIEIDVEAIAQALVNIYKQTFDIDHTIEENLYRETCRIFDEAINNGIADAAMAGVPLPNTDLLRELQHNTEVFSAFRVHRMQKDIAATMVDSKGSLKSFRQFVKDASSYIDHRNRAWLQTEYDTAVLRAQNAAEWKEFRAEADVYPNLEWIPSTSPNPGADHRVFWGTVRPVNDPFWNEHKPGDRWNCKCELRQTERNETPIPHTAGEQNAQAGLETNPADGQIFSRKHPYFPKNCTACPFAGNKLAALVNNLVGKRDCNRCRACDKRIATAKRKAEAQQVSRDKAAIMSIVRAHEMAEKRPNKLIAVKAMRTGKMLDSKKTFKSLYYHEINAGEVEALISFYKKPSKAKFVRISPLGEGKDMSNPRDIANVAKKKSRGVMHYNVYELKNSNGVYLLKTEVRQKGFEIPYFIRRKK